MTRKRALVLRHVAFEDLGSMAPAFEQAGYHIDQVDAPLASAEDLAARNETADVLVILGGPIGVGDRASYPLIETEIALVKWRLERRLPVLGLCLGAQIIAAALGARVYPGVQKEIGWAPLSACSGVLAPLAGVPLLHWHGDTFDLPEGAQGLAATALTPNQAFSHGPEVLALQFHAEVRAAGFENWLIGHANEIAQAGLDVARLRSDAKRFGVALEPLGAQIAADWLAGLDRG